MAKAKTIKGITVEINGKSVGLLKSMDEVTSKGKKLNAELNEIKKGLKLDPENVELLSQKQTILAEAVAAARAELQALEDAQGQVSAQYASGQIDRGAYLEFQNKIILARKNLKNLEEQADTTNTEIARIKSGAIDGVADAAENAGEAMADAADEGKDLESQLKQIDRVLKLDPGNVDVLDEKFVVLADAIEGAAEELAFLESEQSDIEAAFSSGDIDRGAYLDFQEVVATARKRLRDLEKQADQTAEEIKKIKEEPIEEVEEAAEEAGEALEKAGDSASTFGDVLKAGTIIEAAKGIAEAVGDIVEETGEYRKIMGTLAVSSQDAGYTADETQEAYKRLFGVLGDEQAAATTLANLQALQLPQAELLGLIDNTTGAWAKYGDSIPIDGLAESINETIRAGQVTGTFADVINWGSMENETFGVSLKENIAFTELTEKELKKLTDTQREEYEATKAQYEAIEDWNQRVTDATSAEDYFNLALEACGDETERTNLLMQAMKDQGLGPLADAWRETNADIVAANETQADFSEKTAEMAERVAPVVNEVKEGVNELVDVLLEATEGVDYEGMASGVSAGFGVLKDIVQFLVNNGSTVTGIIVAIVGGLVALKGFSFVSTIAGTLKGVTTLTGAMSGLAGAFPALSGAFTLLTNPVGLIVVAIGAVIAVLIYLWNTSEEFRAGVTAAIQAVWKGILAFCQGVQEGFNQFVAGLKMIGQGFAQIFDGIKSAAAFGLDALRATTSEKLNNIKAAYTENGGGIKGIVAATMTGIQEAQTFGLDYLDTLTGGKLTSIKNQFQTKLDEARTAVSTIMDNIKSSFSEKIEQARAKIQEGINNIKNAFNFSWSLPHLKLPHISVSGGVAPYGIGGKGSLPVFSIEWYKKGGILNGAQIFGALGGNLLGGGEAGPEAVLPLRSFYEELARILDDRLGGPGGGGTPVFNQYNTYNSPKALTPSECARQTRVETQKVVAKLRKA